MAQHTIGGHRDNVIQLTQSSDNLLLKLIISSLAQLKHSSINYLMYSLCSVPVAEEKCLIEARF